MEFNEDLDSHADTIMFVSGFIVLGNLDMECKFYPYSSEYEPNIVPLVNSVTVYCHMYGNTYILRLNQSLVTIYEDINLLCMFQIISNGSIVKNFPSSLKRREKESAILFFLQSCLEFPLELYIVMSYLTVRTPIQ